MIYSNAADLFRYKFNKEELIPLFRHLQSREINPEIWDKQIKFWSSIILKWGDQFNIVDFSVNQLAQAFEFHEVIPNIQPSIDSLVKSHQLVSRDFIIKKDSFIKSIAAKLFGKLYLSNQQQCDVFIFSDNLKQLSNKIISEVKIQESCATDVVLTNDEIKSKYCQFGDYDVNYEYLRYSLENNPNIKAYDNGLYFRTDIHSSLSDEYVNVILKVKLLKHIIERKLKDIEQNIKKELSLAPQYKRRNQKTQFINCLRKWKTLEKQENILSNHQFLLSTVLLKLGENELNKNFVNTINQFNLNSKQMLPSIDDIDDMMKELSETMGESEDFSKDLSSAIESFSNYQINDDEIEKEYEAIMNGNNNEYEEPIETSTGFKYNVVRSMAEI